MGADKVSLISDELWFQIELLLPEHRTIHPLGRHRQRVPNREVMAGIFFVLSTGCCWNALNGSGICSSSTAFRRYKEWRDAGVFELFLERGLCVEGIDWGRISR